MHSLSPVKPISTAFVLVFQHYYDSIVHAVYLVMGSGRIHLSEHIILRTFYKAMVPIRSHYTTKMYAWYTAYARRTSGFQRYVDQILSPALP
jgi:hypothetical protein